MTAIAVVLLAWIFLLVPDFPGQSRGSRPPILRTLTIPGVAPVLFVTTFFVLAQTILYTYIATFLGRLGMGGSVDVVLLVFGVASLASIWIIGAHIDRRLRLLAVASAVLFAVATTGLALLADSSVLVYVAVTLWGIGWGGAPTLLQTAAGNAGGEAGDTAQAMLVTLWNVATAAGGVVGGVLLDVFGPGSLPWVALVLGLPALAVILLARSHGFPARSPIRTAAG